MATYPLIIITPEGHVFEDEVEAVSVPGYEGSLGVLAQHAPMICATVEGVAELRLAGGKMQYYQVGEGTLEVRPPKVILLAEHATAADSLEAARAPRS